MNQTVIADLNLGDVVSRLLKGEEIAQWLSIPCSEYALVSRHDSSVFLKCFLPRNRLELVKAAFIGSRCARSKRGTQLLLDADLQAPENIASGKVDDVEWLLSAAAKGVGYGDYFLYLGAQPEDNVALRYALLTELGSTIGKMHSRRIVHGDLRPNNVMVDLERTENKYCFIDNERTRRYWPVIRPRERIRNLVQIMMLSDHAITQDERSCFFKAYSEVCVYSLQEQSALQEQVMVIANRRLNNKSYNALYNESLKVACKRVTTFLAKKNC